MFRTFLLPLLVGSAGCVGLDPGYWNCDEGPDLSRMTPEGEDLVCEGPEDCPFQVGGEELLILWGRSCDAFYPLEIIDVRVEPPIAEWSLEPFGRDPSETMVSLTPEETGNATLSLEYAWQGGSREFQIEIQILPEE
jgi:hypothetical protein